MLPVTDPYTLTVGCAYLALVLMLGYAIVCATSQSRTRHWVGLISLSFAAGSGVLPLLLFAISIAGFKPSRPVLIGIAIIAIAAIIWLGKNGRIIQPSVPSRRHKFDPLSFVGLLSLGLIAAAGCNITAFASWPGLLDIDSFAIWMLKAKWVYFDALRPMLAVFHDPILSYSHQDYPLSLPFLVAGLWAAIGHVNDNAAKLLLVPTWCAMTGMMYSAIRRFHRRATALAVTAVFCTAPTLAYKAGLLVAETPLLLAMVGTATQLLRWMEEGETGDLILAGLFAAIAAFAKNEGLAMLPVVAVAALIVAIVRNFKTPVLSDSEEPGPIADTPGTSGYLRTGVPKNPPGDFLLSAVICIIAIGPWLIYRTHLPRTHEDYGTKLLRPSAFLKHLPQLSEILNKFIGRLFDFPRVGLIWALLVMTTVLSPRALRRLSVWVLWCILLVQLSLYLATFIVTPWDLQILIPMITPKLQTQASGIAALIIALNLRDTRWPAKEKILAPTRL
jgi:hypothetical protein